MTTRPVVYLAVMALLSSGCSSDFALGKDAASDGDWDTGGSENDGAGSPEPSSPGDNDEAPPESEDDFLALMPAQTDVHIFIANPARDTVTRVNVHTQEVRTTTVGANPSVVGITPDYTTAAVFNKGDDTLSIIDAVTLDTATVDVRDNLNNMVISPDGLWAALWHDIAAERPDDPPLSGAASFNEISLVDLTTGEHVPMVVGFNPKDIQFTPDGRLAVVVSDAHLAVVDLTSSELIAELIPIAEDPLDPPVAEEVAVSPDGHVAFVRQFGFDALTVVDLDTHDVDTVPVGLNPTDLDLSPDGTEAVVISRAVMEISIFNVADPFADPRVIDIPGDDLLGALQINAASNRGVIYTTATLSHTYATWNLDNDDIQLRPLVKPVDQLTMTPTGGSMLVVHTLEDNADGTTPEAYREAHAVSLIDLDDQRANTLRLQAEPSGYANATDGNHGYLVMEGQPYFEVLDYRTLIFDELELRSDPVWIGVLPDLDPDDGAEPPAWISQEHELGRLSFYDPDDGTTETITGFELNSQIED